jgi:hypothetical protein
MCKLFDVREGLLPRCNSVHVRAWQGGIVRTQISFQVHRSRTAKFSLLVRGVNPRAIMCISDPDAKQLFSITLGT